MPKRIKNKKIISRIFLQDCISFLAGFVLIALIGLFIFLVKENLAPPCANSISCINNLSGKYEANATEGMFNGQKVKVPAEIAENLSNRVLGATTGPKRILINLSEQRLYALEGDTIVYNFLVSTGSWHLTPTGSFQIWIKLRYTRMTGGSGAGYYDLPNVPYTMFLYGDGMSKSDGYAIHGTYWHHNFGHSMSHGCINVATDDMEKLYYWVNPSVTGFATYATDQNPGTPVTIVGTTPAS